MANWRAVTGKMENSRKNLDGNSYCRGCGGTEYVHDFKTKEKECSHCGSVWADRDAPDICSWVVKPEPPSIALALVMFALLVVVPVWACWSIYDAWTTYPERKPIVSTSWQQTAEVAFKVYKEDLRGQTPEFCLKKEGGFVPGDESDLGKPGLRIMSMGTTVSPIVFCP